MVVAAPAPTVTGRDNQYQVHVTTAGHGAVGAVSLVISHDDEFSDDCPDGSQVLDDASLKAVGSDTLKVKDIYGAYPQLGPLARYNLLDINFGIRCGPNGFAGDVLTRCSENADFPRAAPGLVPTRPY
jgi:hypothetical protein